MCKALVAFLAAFSPAFGAPASPAPLAHGHYKVLPAEPGANAPFPLVDFTYGPAVDGGGVAWQLTIRTEDSPIAKPLMELRAVTSRDPLADSVEPLTFRRYQLCIPGTSETLEYRNVHTGQALLPAWGDFVKYFIPSPVKNARRQQGFPNTCEYLGHVLTLARTGDKAEWKEWGDAKLLSLDPELLIGTSRDFKDKEGHRLPQQPQRQNYTYIPFTADDYKTMIQAGVNLFTVAPSHEAYVRAEPVFYLRGAGGDPPLRYPADLYRSNYVGNRMFMDEPTCIMIGDKRIHTTLRYFTDAAATITERVRSRHMGSSHDGIYSLERELQQRSISFGDMRLAVVDYPAWETVYETTWYQLAGGVAGLVHEGRYQLDEFNTLTKASTGIERKYKPEEMFRYIYAQMRGAARSFGKDWGTSIYGQADPKLSPLAMQMAYDRGARYLWYWSSDHDHHLPWLEQLELTRSIRKYAAEHPRPSIRADRPALDKVITIPYGYFLTLESATNRATNWDLWWVREMDPEKKNEASQRYRRLMVRVFEEVNKALDAGEDFDLTVDDGREITGYRKVVRLADE